MNEVMSSPVQLQYILSLSPYLLRGCYYMETSDAETCILRFGHSRVKTIFGSMWSVAVQV